MQHWNSWEGLGTRLTFNTISIYHDNIDAFLQDHAEHIAERIGTTAVAGGITPGVRALDSHQPKVFSQASMRHGLHLSGSPAINGGSATSINGVASTVSAPLLHLEHTPQPPAAAAECNGFSSFVLRSTFVSGIIKEFNLFNNNLCKLHNIIIMFWYQSIPGFHVYKFGRFI